VLLNNIVVFYIPKVVSVDFIQGRNECKWTRNHKKSWD